MPDSVSSMAIDMSGNLFMTGVIAGNVALDTVSLSASANGQAFIAKIPGCIYTDSNTVSLQPFVSVFSNTPAFTLLGGNPVGGIYSGTGVTAGHFNPSKTLIGQFVINYTVHDSNFCISNTNQLIRVDTGVVPVSVQQSVCRQGHCNGEVIANPVGIAPFSYHWSNEATSSSVKELSPGNYAVTVTDSAGAIMVSPMQQISSSDTITAALSVYSPHCSQDYGKITAITSDGIPPYSYKWNSNATTQMVTYRLGGNYIVSIIDSNGCSAAAGVVLKPLASLLFISNKISHASCSSCSNGSIITFVLGGTSPYTYLWSTGDTSASITNILPGIYFVTVTDMDGCINVDSGFVSFSTSANSLNNVTDKFQLYPNPISDYLSIISYSSSFSNQLEIKDLLGRSVYQQPITSKQTTIDVSRLSAGIYFAVLKSKDGSAAVRKFVKE